MPEATADDIANDTCHVFVYGTLRQGDDNDINRLTPPPVFVPGHDQRAAFSLGPLPRHAAGWRC